MKILAVVIALEAAASAQPPTESPPPSAHDMAVRMTNAARNAAAAGKCESIDALDRRVRELDATYYAQVFAVDAAIERCRPSIAAPGMVAPIAAATPQRSVTIEAGIGVGVSNAGGDEALRGLGGPAVGIGAFVTPTLALPARLSGSLVSVDGAAFYVGVLGPNAQAWVSDNVWVGGGLGLALVAGCGDGDCAHTAGFGLDARLGYAFRPRGHSGANVSLEAMQEWFGGSDGGVTTIAVMLGYQAF